MSQLEQIEILVSERKFDMLSCLLSNKVIISKEYISILSKLMRDYKLASFLCDMYTDDCNYNSRYMVNIIEKRDGEFIEIVVSIRDGKFYYENNLTELEMNLDFSRVRKCYFNLRYKPLTLLPLVKG